MTMAATSGVDVVRVDDGGCRAWLAAGGFGRSRRCGCSRRSWLLGPVLLLSSRTVALMARRMMTWQRRVDVVRVDDGG